MNKLNHIISMGKRILLISWLTANILSEKECCKIFCLLSIHTVISSMTNIIIWSISSTVRRSALSASKSLSKPMKFQTSFPVGSTLLSKLTVSRSKEVDLTYFIFLFIFIFFLIYFSIFLFLE